MVVLNQALAQQMLQLCTTGLEGLRHVHQRNKEGHFESTALLFHDVVWAFAELERTMEEDGAVMSEDLREAKTDLLQSLTRMVEAYEAEDHARILEHMELELMPRYERWHRALHDEFQAHLN